MALGFSKLHQQVPLTKFLGTTKDMKRNKVVIKTIFCSQYSKSQKLSRQLHFGFVTQFPHVAHFGLSNHSQRKRARR